MCGFHSRDALPRPLPDILVQHTGCPRVKVRKPGVLVDSWVDIRDKKKAVASPTKDRWKLAEQPCESIGLFRARLLE